MYVANIIAEDMDVEEGAFTTLGPYETFEAANEDGDAFCQFLDDEFPDHEWAVDVCEVKTYNEAILEYRS